MGKCVWKYFKREENSFHQRAGNEFRAVADERQERGRRCSFRGFRPMGWSAAYSLCTSRSRDIPLGKRPGRMMASPRGWSTASSLLFTTARWCGFFAFKVSGRISPEQRTHRAMVPPGEMGQPAREGTGAGSEERRGKGIAPGPGSLPQRKAQSLQSWLLLDSVLHRDRARPSSAKHAVWILIEKKMSISPFLYSASTYTPLES